LRALLRGLVAVPVFALALLIALANREPVLISFDPFMPTDPSFGLRLPLYLTLFSTLILGMILGGLASWLSRPKG
jgi:hypothetical protein